MLTVGAAVDRKREPSKVFAFSSTASVSERLGMRFDNLRAQITYLDPATLIPRSDNPRTHSPQQLQKIATSIRCFGFISPVLVDGRNQIIAGNARVDAAKQVGLARIPVVCVEHLSPVERKAFAIAENRTAELAGWDNNLLALDLKEISFENSLDITATGFETAEIDLIVGEAVCPDRLDESPPLDRSIPAVSRLGDIFQIGRHRLLCADALHPASHCLLLNGHKAQMAFGDPPYNLRIAGHVSGLGKNKHGEFAQASGELDTDQFTDFLATAAARISEASRDGAVVFLCMDWRHSYELQRACLPLFGAPINLCVWAKTNGGMGSLYRSQHELVFVFKNGSKPHINNILLGKYGRCRTNVWNYAGVNSFGSERDAALAMHPTVKPVAMIADAIMDCSNRGGIILDSFAGSGSSLIAAEKTGRRGYGIEIDPHYVDVILKRFEDTYGLKAVHIESGLSLTALANRRCGERGSAPRTKPNKQRSRKDTSR
jgi:DNA modification methylase